MLTVYSLNPDKRLAVTIAVFFAEDALSFWEAEFPENMRPRKAIEAAKEWIVNPCQETVDAAYAAAAAAANATATTTTAPYANVAAANAATYAAYAAYTTAASATTAAAYAAANAAAANATHAAYAAAYTANAAAYAVSHAADAANRRLYTHNKLAQLLPHLLEYKIYIKTSFEDPEQVFDLLSKQNQQRFLFSLDCLR